MGRAPCCDKANVKKGPWSPEEDAKLKQFIEEHGTGGNWISLPQKAGLKRCGKSCRLRWLNYLRPNIKHGHFSEDEDTIICSLYASIGSRWSIIASQLPGRTDNDIKNYWNTKLKKKLLGVPPHSQRKSSSNQTDRHQETLIISNNTSPNYAIAACSNHSQHHSLSSNLGYVTRSCTNDHDQPMFHCTSTTNASLYQNPNFNIDNYQFGAYDQKMVSCSSSDVSNEEIEKFSESYLYGGLEDQNHLLNYNSNWINNPASYIYSSTNGSSGDMNYV